MKQIAIVVLVLAACGKGERQPSTSDPTLDATHPPAAKTFGLAALRKALATTVDGGRYDDPPPAPPPELFEIVRYDAPLGKQVAYASPVQAGARRPAIVWIVGGFAWGVSETAWEPASRDNDQSARAFREAGIVMMYPALRGANGNPGHNECFLGEVDDIIAAAAYLAARPDVDPERIYLGGHSTGGTLAVLTAASSDRFRAIFALGAVVAAEQYGDSGCLPPGASAKERDARSAIPFLEEVVTPTYVIEGSDGNAAVLPMVTELKGKAPITVIEVPGFDHFDVIAPATEVVARAIIAGSLDGVTAKAITVAR